MKCNNDPRRTSSIFALQEHMAETRTWKKVRRLVEYGKCSLCGEHRDTVQHLLARCKKLVGAEYVKRYNIKWAMENGVLPENTMWYATN